MKPFPVSNIAEAKRIKRDGNQMLWLVSFGGGVKMTVRTHAMCNEKTAVKRALTAQAATIDRINAAWVKGEQNSLPNCVPSESFSGSNFNG